MTFRFDHPDEDKAAIAGWFDAWGGHVAAVDFRRARALFDPGALGFGTWMDMVEGLDALESRQWRGVWPTIQDFRHQTEGLRVGVSADRCFAFGMLVWTSTGFDADARPYGRPGRTTAVFVRERAGDPWRAIHTHVSLFRGVPQKSHGSRPEAPPPALAVASAASEIPYPWDRPEADKATIAAWFDGWDDHVAAVDYAKARPYFDPGILSFGTWLDIIAGLEAFEANQWRKIWPTSADFKHRLATLRVALSPDRLLAAGMLIWTSTGFHADGTPFERPGRTTACLARDSLEAPWRAVHTHVSLFRGVPQTSHGTRPEAA
ncbi:MAG: hypothetical protein EXQ87_04715 [Alphaproteobacteria bacterium]|nr:hypothetical protein [Alphaproteobacteria bacterium]